MKLSTTTYKINQSYEEIIISTDERLLKIKETIVENNVVFFLYKGMENRAIVMFKNNDGVYSKICPCEIKKSNPELLYVLCYSTEPSQCQ